MPPGNGLRHQGGGGALLELHQKIDRSYKPGRGRCLRPCKVFRLNPTKMFDVKHFGTIQTAGNESRLVGLRNQRSAFPAAHAGVT